MERKKTTAIVTNGYTNRTSLACIYKIISAKKSNIIYYPEGNEKRIVDGFKLMYMAKTSVNALNRESLEFVIQLLKNNCHQITHHQPIFKPRSRPKDVMGFSQHTNFNLVYGIWKQFR